MNDLLDRICGEQMMRDPPQEGQYSQKEGSPLMGFAWTVWGLKRRITNVANSDMTAARGWRRDMGSPPSFRFWAWVTLAEQTVLPASGRVRSRRPCHERRGVLS